MTKLTDNKSKVETTPIYMRMGKKLVGFDLVLRNIPGALNYVISILTKHQLNIISVELCELVEEYKNFFILVDFTDKDILPKAVLEEVRSNKRFVVECELSPVVGDMVVSRFFSTGETTTGIRMVSMPMPALKGLILGLRERLGDIAATFLYHVGRIIGVRVYGIHVKRMNIEDVEEALKVLFALFKGTGVAEVIHYGFKKGRGIVRMRRLLECEVQPKGEKPGSHFVRGLLAGFLESILNKPVKVLETKCIVIGDEYCEFKITYGEC